MHNCVCSWQTFCEKKSNMPWPTFTSYPTWSRQCAFSAVSRQDHAVRQRKVFTNRTGSLTRFSMVRTGCWVKTSVDVKEFWVDRKHTEGPWWEGDGVNEECVSESYGEWGIMPTTFMQLAVLIWNSECRGDLWQSNLFGRKGIRGRNYFYWNLKT